MKFHFHDPIEVVDVIAEAYDPEHGWQAVDGPDLVTVHWVDELTVRVAVFSLPPGSAVEVSGINLRDARYHGVDHHAVLIRDMARAGQLTTVAHDPETGRPVRYRVGSAEILAAVGRFSEQPRPLTV